MTIYEVLKKDHAKVRELLGKLEKTTEKGLKVRAKLWAEVTNELTVHADLEEQMFYPPLEAAEETRELTLEAHEEHHYAKVILGDIDAVPFEDEQWKAKFMVFKENVEHHAREEEKELFPKARKVLSTEQAKEIGKEFEAAKKARKKAGGAKGARKLLRRVS